MKRFRVSITSPTLGTVERVTEGQSIFEAINMALIHSMEMPGGGLVDMLFFDVGVSIKAEPVEAEYGHRLEVPTCLGCGQIGHRTDDCMLWAK